ncbi:unnamed protein product [Danaus chrysippus]|uniref:(African queen) hypothetical protein n=1 Tax=Danaus chrysippus TaxID=151541 RepID=A0A8J2R9H3_9NEOP|nr:unnamed protein product [Danaus chrysippus]
MDNSNKIVPPHLNAEVYRTDTTGTSTQSFLDYIRIHNDGTILVGCSELTGRYWNGGAYIFDKAKEGKNVNSGTKKCIYLTSGTADGCFIESSNKILLCEDSGAVSIWNNKDDAWKQWSEELSVAEHDGGVMAVDCLSPGKEYVTVGADGNVKVWDIIDLICMRNYIAAHNRSIYAVSTRPSSLTSFATGSLDYYVTLWDENVANPVLELSKSTFLESFTPRNITSGFSKPDIWPFNRPVFGDFIERSQEKENDQVLERQEVDFIEPETGQNDENCNRDKTQTDLLDTSGNIVQIPLNISPLPKV